MTSALISGDADGTRTLLVVDAGNHGRSRTAALAGAVADTCLASLPPRARASGRETDDRPWSIVRVDLRDHGHDLLDALVLGHRSGAVDVIVEASCRADLLVLATPCHNASISALGKLYLDVLPQGAVAGLPVVIAVAGSSTRHTLVGDLVVRPLLSTLGARPIPTSLYAAEDDWLAVPADNALGPQLNSDMAARIARAAHEAAWATYEFRSTSGLAAVGSPREWHNRASLTV